MSDGKIVIDTDLDSSGLESGLKKLGSITTKGLKAATVAITGTATAMGGIATAAVKVGSDFEAQMSRVQAISGATGDEFEALREQAVELGADTAFSATEAAQGMENLAAAGFTTSEIMDAMPGMLNLAAAAGEDLASSADIAASTLRGFGLEASDAAHVADVLAENANRTNSSVSETGEAMKYVAPLARAAGISLEETAAAIGIMANAGIQGSQAGTTLRGALSRLSKPTDVMAQAMDELGVSFYDSEGKMLSLTDQVKMMRTAMEGMTDEQKNNYLVTLYGQEALSGMLALINEGEGSLADLTEAYENCDGAAETAAKTMQDNLKGAIEELSGSAETLGIVFYDSVSENLKDAVQVVNESVDNITDAFNSGGMDVAISAAGDEFADLAAAAASHAPEMVDAAVDFIQSFADGIVSNRGQLVSAAGEAAEAIGSGLAELLPSELQEPVEDAVEAIADSLESGGLKKAGKAAANTFENLIDVAGTLADITLPLLTGAVDLVGGNLGVVAPLAASTAAAFKTYNAVTKITASTTKTVAAATKTLTAMEKANALQLVATNGGLTLQQTLIALHNGQITATTALTGLWAKAQTALNTAMAANPIGLVVAAVATLAAGIGALYLMSDKQTKVTAKLSDEQKKLRDNIDQTADELSNMQTSMQESVQSSTQEIDATKALWQELQTLVDANGKVKAGYEARAEYITGELSSALGVEMDLVDGVIQGYSEQKSAIEDLIETKRAQAALDGMEQSYQEAVQKSTEALNEYLSAQKESETAAINLSGAKQKLSSLEKQAAEEARLYGNTTAQTNEAVLAAQQEVDQLSANYDELSRATSDAKTNYEGYQTVIQQYEGLSAAIISGDTAAIKDALLSVQADFVRYGEVTDEELKKSVVSASSNMALLGDAIKSGTVSATDSAVTDFANMTAMSLAELSKLPGGAAAQFSSIEPEAVTALIGLSGSLSSEAKEAVSGFLDGFNGLDSETQEIWANTVYGALQGLEGFEDLSDPAEEGVDAFLESLADALEVHSPSRAVKDIFAQVWPGAVEGLSEGEDSLNEKGGNVISSFLTTIREGGLLEGAKQIGSNIINFFTGGMTSQKGNVDAASRNIAESSNVILGSMDTEGTGSRKTEEYNAGVESNKGEIDTTSREIADSSNQLLGYADTKGTGSRKSREYDTGVGSNKGKIDTTSRNIADSSNTILGSKDTRGTGSRKSSEYNAGVGSNKGAIDNTSKNIANSSNSNLGSADTRGTGSRKGSEYNSGLGSNSGSINSTGRSLSNTANSGMGSADTWGTGRNKGDEFNSGIGSADSWGTGRSKAQDAKNGMGSVDAGSTGSNFVSGFINGFGWQDVWSAAYNIGMNALDAIKSALGIKSPSREAKKVGAFFGEGFELGITDEEKNIGKASEKLADTALNALDMSDISARMSEAMAFNTNRITRSFALESSSRIISEQHTDNTMHLSDEDIIRLAKEFGKVAGDAVADNVEGMAIKTNSREFGRVVREVERQ